MMAQEKSVESPAKAKAHNTLQPFLKWAGGKRQLIPVIRPYLPAKFNTYFEPFVGAGAMLFELRPEKAVINDLNGELVNCYRVIRDLHIDLIEDLRKHKNTPKYFYDIRELDRTNAFAKLSLVQRASRIIYLNKTCYNGLFRVNRSGHFNAPFGRYKNPNIVNEAVIESIHGFLNTHHVKIMNSDFAEAVQTARRGDFVYFDPPYDPLSDTASFTGYASGGFGRAEQERLRDLFEKLTLKGVKVMLSNSATPFVAELYRDYRVITIRASRNINSVGSERKKINEFLVLNYAAED